MKSLQLWSVLSLGLLLSACSTVSTPTAAPQTGVPTPAAQVQLAELEHNMAASQTAGDVKRSLRPQDIGDCPTELAAPYNAAEMHMGLYWYAPSQQGALGGVGCLAREDGGAISGYYDPSKPVLIFVHGWQPGYVKGGLQAGTTTSSKRHNFWFEEGRLNVADEWIKAGWNVAIFHWTQLADDESSFFVPYNAQAKIWTTDYKVGNTPIGMRYMTASGYSSKNSLTVSAGTLFYQAYKSALSQYEGQEVRVVGHSLGAQLMLAMADQAYQDPALAPQKLPARLALTDPYWSPSAPAGGNSYAYLAPDKNPAARSLRIISELQHKGAVIDWIKTSSVLDLGGDNNEALMRQVTRTELHLGYELLDMTKMHNAAPQWYMLTKDIATGATTASGTQEEARAFMQQAAQYEQNQGRMTPRVDDDTFWKLH